jgi:hypothetical protein
MRKTAIALVLAVLSPMMFVNWTAHAASLWWSKFPVRAQRESRCMEFAYAVASQQGLTNIRRIPIEVAGTKGNVYVSMTCVGRGAGQNAITIVMTMSDDLPSAKAVHDQIAAQLAKMVSFD